MEGVSTRRVEDLVQALGCEGISKSQVSRICSELDGVVGSFLGRPLDGGPYPYLRLDVREDGRIVNVSVVVATAVNHEGKREVLGIDVGTSEDGAFWLAFLRSLVARGTGWGGAGDLRCAPGLEGRHRHRLRRGLVAALPHPLHDEPARQSPSPGPTVGGDDGADDLSAALAGRRPRPTRTHGGHAR